MSGSIFIPLMNAIESDAERSEFLNDSNEDYSALQTSSVIAEQKTTEQTSKNTQSVTRLQVEDQSRHQDSGFEEIDTFVVDNLQDVEIERADDMLHPTDSQTYVPEKLLFAESRSTEADRWQIPRLSNDLERFEPSVAVTVSTISNLQDIDKGPSISDTSQAAGIMLPVSSVPGADKQRMAPAQQVQTNAQAPIPGISADPRPRSKRQANRMSTAEIMQRIETWISKASTAIPAESHLSVFAAPSCAAAPAALEVKTASCLAMEAASRGDLTTAYARAEAGQHACAAAGAACAAGPVAQTEAAEALAREKVLEMLARMACRDPNPLQWTAADVCDYLRLSAGDLTIDPCPGGQLDGQALVERRWDLLPRWAAGGGHWAARVAADLDARLEASQAAAG